MEKFDDIQHRKVIKGTDRLIVQTGVPQAPFQYIGIDQLTTALPSFKTINGQTVLGVGDITITGGGSVNYANIIFVDITNGDNATGTKNKLDKPFLTYAAAVAAATAGDIIYIRRGTYPDAAYELKDLVDVYCEPGVILLGGFTNLYNTVTVKVFGYANFGSGSLPALRVDGDANISFEFDRIDGVRSYGIQEESDNTVTLKVKGNYINCSAPIRVRSGNKTAVIEISQMISAYGLYAVRLGSSGVNPLIGTISVSCPIIEVTGSGFGRAGVMLAENLSIAGYNHKIFIKADVIRMTNPIMTETRPNIISAAVWHRGGYNIEVTANLEGNACLGVDANLQSGPIIFGTMVIKGDVSSNIECVSSNCKYTNGNGWGNVVFKNGLIKSLGLGASGAVVETGNVWSPFNGGVNGDIQFVNCVLYNAATNGKIVQHDIPNDATDKNIYFYDCIAYTEGVGGFFASSVQANKRIGLHNVRSNKPLDSMVTDPFSPTGLIVDTNLIIPKI